MRPDAMVLKGLSFTVGAVLAAMGCAPKSTSTVSARQVLVKLWRWGGRVALARLLGCVGQKMHGTPRISSSLIDVKTRDADQGNYGNLITKYPENFGGAGRGRQ